MSYRTPAEVVEVAAQVLAVAAPAIAPPRPVRQSGETPRLVARVAAPDWPRRWPRSPGEEVAAVSPGRVAVLGPAVLLPELARALADAGLHPTDPRDPLGDGLVAGLVLLPADETNGLEFDAVVVVEPALVAVGRRASRGRGPAGGDDTGIADPLRGADPTDQTAGRRPCRAAPGPPGDPDGAMKPRAPGRRGSAVTCLLALTWSCRLEIAL